MRKYNHILNPGDGAGGSKARSRLSVVPVSEVVSRPPSISTSTPVSISPPDLSDFNPAACFLAQLQPTGGRSTRARLERAAALLGATLGTLRWHELRFEHVVAVRAYLQSQNLSPSSVNMTLSSLRSVARAAKNLGQMSAENYDRIREVKSVRGTTLPAGRAIEGWLALRGRRPGALLCPVRKDGVITAVRHLSGTSVYRTIARRARQAGLAHLSPHDLRRTLVSNLLDHGEDIETVRDLCGHTNVATTARYKRGGERAKKQAIEMLRLPWPRPRPKRTPKCARKSRRQRRRKSITVR